jgi:adenosylcobinamide-GDP ribazoletransferase
MLHLDGFMDSCDGLLPPREPLQRLEIMKDSRVGAFGVVGVILLLLIKFSGLLALPVSQRWLVMLVIPMLGRWAMSWAMIRYPRARPEGMGEFFSRGLVAGQVLVASLIAGGVAVLVLWPGGILLWGSAWLAVTLIARFAIKRLGGLTGDVYGAICEVTEAVMLTTAVILWS